LPAFPIKIEIDLPKPVVNPEQPGWAYEHRFTGVDNNYVITPSGDSPTVWRDPIRHTVMLHPYQLLDEFDAYTGQLARMKLAHFHKDDGTVSTDWEEVNYRTDKNTFLMAKTTNQRLTTSRKWRPNQPFFLRAFPFGPFDKRNTWFELELGKPTRTGTPNFKIVVRFDGSFSLFKDGATTAIYTDYLAPGGVDRLTLQGKPFEMMILPYRRNQILFWTNQGSYPLYTDYTHDSLKPNGGSYKDQEGYGRIGKTDHVITKYGHVGIKFPSSKGYFQLTPVVYKSNASGNGFISTRQPVKLPYKPNSEHFPLLPDQEEGGEEREEARSVLDMDIKASLGVIASLNPQIALDGTDDTLDWSVVLHGHRNDPTNFPTLCDETPFVYGFSYSVPPEEAETADEQRDLTNYIRRFSRTYTEDGSTAELEFKDPLSIDPSYMTALHRVVRIYRETSPGFQDELFYGVATEPEYDQWALSPDGDDHTPVKFRVYDPWFTFETTLMKNFRALDGMRLDLAVIELLKKGGWPADRIDVDVSNVYLPKDERADEKLILSDQIGSLKDQLLMLRDTYTSSNIPPYRRIMDFAPVLDEGRMKIKFRFKDPELAADYSSGGQTRTWYASKEEADTAMVTKDDWVRSYTRRMIEPEANYVEAWGQTPDGTPISVIKEDKQSHNRELEYAERPLNWIGYVRAVIYENPALNTPSQVNAACHALFQRLSSPRLLAEWEGEYSYDDRLWDRHKMIHDSNRKYWVKEYTVEHLMEDDDKTVRPARYVGEARE
jgi:hypothetical protein